ncbi:acyl-CoA Delta(11) desaturase isoform X2 [Nilaparvata lugens]|nr:acyl-CoA Delta(11) desaturase isoform X2 [Nilaparvata lugens]
MSTTSIKLFNHFKSGTWIIYLRQMGAQLGARQQIIWINVVLITLWHLLAVYTAVILVPRMQIITILWGYFVGIVGGFGVTAGAHRLWAHRAYKAKLPLQLILLMCYSTAGQNSVFDWVRDHRVHHKFSETDADPHNAKRGFFFAHVGWLMQRKHPEVLKKGALIDMSDITGDPILAFHTKYFNYFKLFFCFIFPVLVPYIVLKEPFYHCFMGICFIRYILGLNFTWSVNSAAHIWGNKPYDKRINPAENLTVSILAMGEGWHNYHHVFPWDYRAAELGHYLFNSTTVIIDLFAKIGWAYDLKSPSPELVQKISKKYGDGTEPYLGRSPSHHDHPEEVPHPDHTVASN